jgi:hypothetical protein
MNDEQLCAGVETQGGPLARVVAPNPCLPNQVRVDGDIYDSRRVRVVRPGPGPTHERTVGADMIVARCDQFLSGDCGLRLRPAPAIEPEEGDEIWDAEELERASGGALTPSPEALEAFEDFFDGQTLRLLDSLR